MDIEKGKYIGHILPSRVSLTVWLIDDFTRESPSGQAKVVIDGSYLFNWDEIQGNDDKLIELLEHDFGINWAQPDDITKPDDTTIIVSDGSRLISLWLNDDKTTATRAYLKIDDVRIDEFIVRMENDIPKIYRERNIAPIKNLSGYYVFKDLPSGIFEVSVESDHYFFEKKIIDTTRINNPDVSLEFHANGPAEGALFAILKETSKLKTGDIVELMNPKGNLEQRMINDIDTNTKTISWDERLTKDFSAKYSTISFLRYVPVIIIIKPNIYMLEFN